MSAPFSVGHGANEPDVGGGEGVRFAQLAQRDVLRGPLPDPADRPQPLHGIIKRVLLLGARPRPARNALGHYFARAAHLEAASVFAFERLREDIFRDDILNARSRPDGRECDQIRLITCVVGLLPRVHGSADADPP